MDRLSGLDASFLYLESSAQLLHVCGLLVLDPSTVPGGYSFAEMKATIEKNTCSVEMFRRKLRHVPLDLDHPVWIVDTDFDIDRHVHRMALPAPGGREELGELCAHIAGIPMDRSRPLWEMFVIEGLHDDQVAVFTKMHHCSVDGASGANALSALCSLEPGDAPMDLTEKPGNMRDPGDLELLGRAALTTMAKPLQLAKLVAPTVGALVGTVGRARRGAAMAAPLTAPRTSFNGTITGHRSVAFIDVSLKQIKEVKNLVEGSTVNDVVITLCGGALRHYLDKRGELPEASLLASVPVSVREKSEHGGGSNKVSALFSRLGTDIADPLERLQTVSEANLVAKEHQQAIPADALQDWAQFAAPRSFAMATRMMSALRLAERGPVVHNLIVSNVPGPPVAMYFVGAKVEGLYPMGPIMHGAGLNITVISSNGTMHVGITACHEMVPHVWDLADEFPAALEELHEAASSLSSAG